jgi:hypothetical protein
MSLANPFDHFAFGELFDTILPDFVLAFAFFTAIIYLVVGKRFGQNRPAVALSATLGFALSIGLVWWEQAAGLSIRNLGPIAAGFALLILAGLIYQAIKQVGGSWAGGGIAIGACLIIGWVLDLRWLKNSAILSTVTAVALTIGIIAFLSRNKGKLSFPAAKSQELAEVRHDMNDLYEDRRVSHRLADRFKNIKKEIKLDGERSPESQDIVFQLQRILPAEGWLTERLAKLREKIHHLEEGDIERIRELQKDWSTLPPQAKEKAGRELQDRYKALNLERRLDRLDEAAAANEKRICQINEQARNCAATNDYSKLTELLKAANVLQKHNSRLFKIMNQTEAKLTSLVKEIVKQHTEVKPK